ncbi:MAG: hypothetical protein JNJ83_00895 [Verrucomicrobiaceae bacterium]|nr:hypothetical protein [Verrucomicrobiaceae bacterium]
MLDAPVLLNGLEAHRTAVWRSPSDAVDTLPRMLGRRTIRCAWLPSWYASDQPLYRDIWAFYRVFLRVSRRLATALESAGVDNIFLSDGMGYTKRYGENTLMLSLSLKLRITDIQHPKLTGIRALTWGHNMFLVTLDDGRCVTLDDEEGAGQCDIDSISPDDWNMLVTAEVDPVDISRLNDYWNHYALR